MTRADKIRAAMQRLWRQRAYRDRMKKKQRAIGYRTYPQVTPHP